MPVVPASALSSGTWPSKVSGKPNLFFRFCFWAFILLAGLFLAWLFFQPLTGLGGSVRDLCSENTAEIGTAMYRYSLDHNGRYPTGQSSTEIFQQLLDEHYVHDPAIFYLWSGNNGNDKREATSSKLKPENVCFDVTVPVTADSPKGLPVVFVTGYKISYKPGGGAVPLATRWPGGIAAAYKDYKHPTSLSIIMGFDPFHVVVDDILYQEELAHVGGFSTVGTIQNFIPDDFDPKGQKFQQLTPDGPMTP